MIELRHLRALATVAEHGHVGRAAPVLGLTQPALSRQIAALERLVGARLFERRASGMVLTAEGERVLRRARSILRDVAALGRSDGPHPVLRIGFMCFLGSTITGEVISRHREAHPQTEMTVQQLPHDGLIGALHEGRLDVALVRPHGDTDGLPVRRLVTEPVAVALPRPDPLSSAPAVTMAQLADRSWILMTPSSSSRRHEAFVHHCREAGFEPTVGSTSGDLQANLLAVAAGRGVFPCPASTPVPQGAAVTLVPIDGWTTGIDLVSCPEPPGHVRALMTTVLDVAARRTTMA